MQKIMEKVKSETKQERVIVLEEVTFEKNETESTEDVYVYNGVLTQGEIEIEMKLTCYTNSIQFSITPTDDNFTGVIYTPEGWYNEYIKFYNDDGDSDSVKFLDSSYDSSTSTYTILNKDSGFTFSYSDGDLPKSTTRQDIVKNVDDIKMNKTLSYVGIGIGVLALASRFIGTKKNKN
jgi:hypothetical protein